MDPDCAVKISNGHNDVLGALRSDSEEDFIVLFFVWIDKVKKYCYLISWYSLILKPTILRMN